MHALLLLAALAAPASTAADAEKLAHAKDWDNLYLAFSSGDPAKFSAADRTKIGDALLTGAKAMASSDPVMAVSLGERAVAFNESVDSLLEAASLEEKADQNGQAAKFLERAVAVDPKSGAAHLARAQHALHENDSALCLKELDAVPAGFQAAQVKALRTKAQAKVVEKQADEAALDRVQQQVANNQMKAPDQAAPKQIKPEPANAKMVNMVDPADRIDGAAMAGLRQKAGEHFVFAYGNNERDWGQRADYEGHVEEALEEAYEYVGEAMHTNRTEPVQVVLYTKQEYEFHFGGSALSRAAGFFSGKIRINGAEEMTPEVRAVIVHEYVHAVLGELMGPRGSCPQWVNEGFATYVENMYRSSRGMPGADDIWRTELHAMAVAGRLPKVASLDRSFLEYSNPRVAYATSGEAMRLLVERYGMDTFVTALHDSAKMGWPRSMAEHLPADMDGLDDEIKSNLSKL
ncbi:MAG: hypothetical protein JST54_03970 [Deltaproteobacteria bacterium]|nr:hypothetical protein [Deltaproteobacteria bacterium]